MMLEIEMNRKGLEKFLVFINSDENKVTPREFGVPKGESVEYLTDDGWGDVVHLSSLLRLESLIISKKKFDELGQNQFTLKINKCEQIAIFMGGERVQSNYQYRNVPLRIEGLLSQFKHREVSHD